MDADSDPKIAGGQFVVAGVTADPSALTLTSERGASTIEPKMMALLVVLSHILQKNPEVSICSSLPVLDLLDKCGVLVEEGEEVVE